MTKKTQQKSLEFHTRARENIKKFHGIQTETFFDRKKEEKLFFLMAISIIVSTH